MTEEPHEEPGGSDLVFTFKLTGRVTARLTQDEARAVLGLDGTSDDMLPLAAGVLLESYRSHYATVLREAGFLDEDCAHPWYKLEHITTPGSYQLYPEN